MQFRWLLRWLVWLRFLTKRRKIMIPTVLGLLVTLGFYLAYVSKPASIEQLGNLVFDSYQKWKPREYAANTPVRIIDIDDESIARVGQWPWPRSTMAKLNDRLANAGAGVIAYDIIFSEPDRTSPKNIVNVLRANPLANGALDDFANMETLKDHDEMFAESFARIPVIAGFFLVQKETDKRPAFRHGFAWKGTKPSLIISQYAGAITPLGVLEEQLAGEGFVSFKPEGDGIVRAAPLLSGIGDRMYPALSVEALRVASGASTYILSSSDGTDGMAARDTKNPEMVKMRVGNFEIPTNKDGEFTVYFSKPHPERFIPAWKILSDEIPQNTWSDKILGHIVFIGTGAEGLKDIVATPIRAGEPGVLVHAQVVEQIIEGQFLQRPYWVGMIELLVLVFTGVILALALPRLGAAKGAVIAVCFAVLIAYGSWYSFKVEQILINPIYPLLAILVSYLLITLTSFYITESERSQIRSAFSMYLSPTMVKKVSEDPSLLKLGGVERELTVLFLDIRSFSKISEGLEAEEITTFLNIFLSPMTTILQDNGATIDKYMGDAIVAFWNAPLDDGNHERNAARAVLEMMRRLSALNKKYAVQTEVKWPGEVRVGIGLNTGICCVGNLGSEQRFSYSMIGDAANLASRIEGLTKQYKVSVLIGNSTAGKLESFAVVEADLIQVIGRQTPERIFILAGDAEMTATDAYKTLMPLHAKFLDAYRAQKWAVAQKYIAKLRTLAEPLDFAGYYDVMSERINIYKTNPPPKKWGGVFVATRK